MRKLPLTFFDTFTDLVAVVVLQPAPVPDELLVYPRTDRPRLLARQQPLGGLLVVQDVALRHPEVETHHQLPSHRVAVK